MDFTQPINASDVLRPRKGRGWRGLLWGLGGVLLFLIAGMAALPWVLSSTWVRDALVSRLNQSLAPACVEVKGLSFAWFGEQVFTGITYTDVRQGVRISVPTVRLNALWELLPIGTIRAEVALDAPVVDLSPPEVMPTVAAVPTGLAEVKARPAVVLPAWDVSIRATVKEATVRHTSLAEPLLTQGAAELTLPSLDHAIGVTMAGMLLDAAVQAEAILTPPRVCLAVANPRELLQTATLAVDAPWATLNANAQTTQCDVHGTVALEPLVQRLQTLGVPLATGLERASGSLAFGATLAPGALAETQTLTLDVRAPEAVSLTYRQKNVRFAPRIGLTVTAHPKHPLGATIERLSLDLPGLMASGKGTLAEGTLAARLEMQPFWETIAPLLGEFSLAHPMTLSLNAHAKKGTLAVESLATTRKSTVAKLMLKAEGIDLAKQAVRSAKAELMTHLEPLTRFFSLPNKQTLSGTGYLNVAAAGSLQGLRGKATFALHDVVYRAASWEVEEPEFLKGEVAFAATPHVLDFPAMTLQTPIGKLEGKVAYTLKQTLAQGLSALVRGSVNPGEGLRKWRVWGKDESPVALSGNLNVILSATPRMDSGALPTVALELAAPEASITLPNQSPFVVPLTVRLTAQDGVPGRIDLSHVALITPYVESEASGTLTLSTATLFLEGSLTPDLEQVWALPPFAAARELGFSVSGRHTRPFALTLPLGVDVSEMLNLGEGQAALTFDRIHVPGLDIPGGSARLTLARGMAELDGRFAVNGGTLTVRPRVSLAAKPYLLSTPENTPLLENVALSQPLLDSALRVINPLLSGSASPQGTVDLICQSFVMPLSETPLADVEARVTLATKSCGITPNGLLGTVLHVLRVDSKMANLPDQQVGVVVDDGVLTCDPIRMHLAAIRLDCAGSTNLLTHELDYALTLPLTEQLVGHRLAKHLRLNQNLRLPIYGTFERPRLDAGPLLSALADSALGRATGTVIRVTGEAGQAAGDQLEQALRTLFRKREK